MKKTLLVVAAVLTLVAALGFAGYAFAQTPTPPFGGAMHGGMMGSPGKLGSYGGGMMNGGGMMGGYGMMGANGNHGPMHEYMLQALAEKLNLTTDELQTRIANGESMWDIARSQGLSDTEVSALMSEAHNQALEAAVAAGAITQEQADWMNNHMQQMHGSGGTGGCHGTLQNNTPSGSNL